MQRGHPHERADEKKCKPCDGNVAPLTRDEAQTLMKQLNADWQLSADDKSLHREWKFQ